MERWYEYICWYVFSRSLYALSCYILNLECCCKDCLSCSSISLYTRSSWWINHNQSSNLWRSYEWCVVEWYSIVTSRSRYWSDSRLRSITTCDCSIWEVEVCILKRYSTRWCQLYRGECSNLYDSTHQISISSYMWVNISYVVYIIYCCICERIHWYIIYSLWWECYIEFLFLPRSICKFLWKIKPILNTSCSLKPCFSTLYISYHTFVILYSSTSSTRECDRSYTTIWHYAISERSEEPCTICIWNLYSSSVYSFVWNISSCCHITIG